MTHHERMLATVRREPTDLIPWAPRMDLWWIAQRARGTLPPQFEGLSTPGIADVLDVGCRLMRADYTTDTRPECFVVRALGIDNHPDLPYRVELRDLPVEFESDGHNFRTTIETSAGTLTMRLRHTTDMERRGISLPFIEVYPIKSTADLAAVAQVFQHMEVIPTPDGYHDLQATVGERGLAVAGGASAASPMHLIMHDMMPMTEFFYLYADSPAELHHLVDSITPVFEAILDTVMMCDCEVAFWGSNYDQNTTWPKFFQAEIAPWLQRVAERLHAGGKYLLTHTDGENQKLLPYYPACNFDIAESVCTQPMTHCTLADVLAGVGERTTVWGGIPSIALLEHSMSDEAFAEYLDQLFASIGTGERLILGVADDVPPDAILDRLKLIEERIEAFGPVRPG
ncbi:MAG: uroporphyrinogen decarboxylase family protein [Lentisphaeria bacterium]|jgi:hypothetical protein|nr:uroporphyrinogen decarboxylase family protein [Lentisphaeria bacterium]MDP7740790.1 uroporphyrinogen decarboxylase family protein [Lentisphaeria bacterium]